MEPGPHDYLTPEPIPEVDTSISLNPQPRASALTLALEEAARTGKKVEVGGETTATSITYALPDGTADVQTTAGPARVEQADGSWAEVDTTLHVTADGVVAPRMVPGKTSFSAGGTDLLASLSDGAGTSITLNWEEELPTPVLSQDTAIYPDVLPDVDLVLKATRLGFSQLLVVNSRPDAATLEELSSIDIPVQTTGADLAEGAGGELRVTDPATGDLVGTAAAPLMWDARTDPRTDQPIVIRDVGLTVDDQTSNPAAASDATLVLTPDAGFLADPGTLYPVTIDPTQTLGALGDTFIAKSLASNQGGSTELRAGTNNGGVDVARSLLRFDVSALKNRYVQSANLALFNTRSWSCTKTYTDIRDVADFDPTSVTWANQPTINGVVASAYSANGYDATCGAAWTDFPLTNWAQNYADSRNNRPNVMPLAVQARSEASNTSWKTFNSGNAASDVPTLTFTFDGNCDQYAGNRVCGSTRDKWWSIGGPSSYLGMPTGSDTTITGGSSTNFTGGSIYASTNPNVGTHIIRGEIRAKYWNLRAENSSLGYPTGEEFCGLSGGGCGQHFERGSIYYSPTTGAHNVQGAIRDKWAALGWQASTLGYPTTDDTAATGGNFSHFQRGSIYYSPTTGAHNVQGAIRDKWAALGWQASTLGYPTTDELPIADGQYNQFTGGVIYFSASTGAHTVVGETLNYWNGLAGAVGVALGFPTSDAYTTDYGYRQDFAAGQILRETATGELRNCTQTGTSGADKLVGTAGDDVICSLGGNDQVDGLDGNDVLHGGTGDDSLTGGPGDDVLEGASGTDGLRGGDGVDKLRGGDGTDHLEGGAENDVLQGEGERDVLAGGSGDDLLQGGEGDDLLAGDEGKDELDGGRGADTLTGGGGEDLLLGYQGDDILSGGAEADGLYGGLGRDSITGDDGDDTLDGGPGDDFLTGSPGTDSCTAGTAATLTTCENEHLHNAEDTLASFAVEAQATRVNPDPLQSQGIDFAIDSELSSLVTHSRLSDGLTFTVKPSESTAAGQYEIALPQNQHSAPAVRTTNGSIVYRDSTGGPSSVIQSVGGAVRVSTVAAASPTTLTYQVDLPDGSHAQLNTAGGIDYIAANGSHLAEATRPSATDASGQAVPTWLEIDGSALILMLDSAQSNFNFPIVTTFDLSASPQEVADSASPPLSAAKALAACTAFAARNTEGSWTCDGQVLTESTSSSGAILSDVDTGDAVTLQDIDAITPTEASSADALIAQAGQGATSGDQPADAEGSPSGDFTTQVRIDNYHANYTSTFFYGTGNVARGNVKFTHQVSLYHNSARDNQKLQFTQAGSDLYWNLRIRRDNSWSHDDTVFNYPDRQSCQAGAGLRTCSRLESQYGDGWRAFPLDSKKYYLEAYGWDFYAGGRHYRNFGGTAQSDRMTCYRTTNCKFRG
ncbi:DNRLRE domain-containing protein [Modestobacter sp. SSW1-42]|uniref:DNRLRE domain-containing protein n=1 Tax=Modestobacter sp. SSW1-42 TaxID=596372 RepID=UPI00398778CF